MAMSLHFGRRCQWYFIDELLNAWIRYIFNTRNPYRALPTDQSNSLDIWRQFTDDAIDLCVRSWEAVRNILCVDSPEGHEIDTAMDVGVQINEKDALSFSWRTLKETR